MRDIKFTCVVCTVSTHTQGYIIIIYIRSLIDLLEIGKRTRNPKHLLARSNASASFVRIFASFTSHKRIVHPLRRIYINRLLQTSSETRAHEKYAIHTFRILCTTHYIRVLLLRRDTVRVHFFVAAPYIIYTYILHIGKYYIHANDRIYIFLCVIDG